MVGFIRKGFEINSHLEEVWRRAAFANRAKRLLANEGIRASKLSDADFAHALEHMPAEAIRSIARDVEFFIGDYRKFNQFEQKFVKRVVPFYSWLRVISKLTFALPFRSPLRAELMAVLAMNGNEGLTIVNGYKDIENRNWPTVFRGPLLIHASKTMARRYHAEVADQVVSLGGEFVKVDYEEEGSGGGGYAKVMSEGFQKAQREMYAKQAKEVDIIITTALIPGKPAPKLITAEMVQSMKPGSVIVDMAAEQGGNCELTEPGKAVVKHGVTIVGYTDLASRMARQSSTLYGTNLFRLTEELCKTKDGVINVNMQDDAIRGLTVIKDGEITWPAPPLPAAAPKPAAKPVAAAEKKSAHGHGSSGPMPVKTLAMVFGLGALAFWAIGAYAPAAFLGHFTVFVLACFIGYMVVWNVTPALHTPLMSVTNAISSIIVIGALVQILPPEVGTNGRPDQLIQWLAFAGIVLTAVNMFGGFAVTRRMLDMFRK